MKSVLNAAVTDELIARIGTLDGDAPAKWGKMNVYQMLRHCALCEDIFLGKLKIKRVFIGRIIGKMILKKVLKDDAPFGKNSPTSPLLKISEQNGDIEAGKKEWINRLHEYSSLADTGFVHPFFGPMTKEQIGVFSYKHADHHLRQFGA